MHGMKGRDKEESVCCGRECWVLDRKTNFMGKHISPNFAG